jgi:hypothetical protein
MAVTVAEAIERITRFSDRLAKDAFEMLKESAYAIKETMIEPGDPVTYPIDWDSVLQQTTAYRTRNWHKGMPYERKGEYEASWKITENSPNLLLFAPDPAAAIGGYPGGEQWQSSIHRGRWNYLPSVLASEMLQFPKRLIEKVSADWMEIIR